MQIYYFSKQMWHLKSTFVAKCAKLALSKFCSEKFISLVGISAVKLFNGIVLNKYHETTSANIRKIKSNTECYRDYTLKTNTQTLRRKKD